ncbi:MAG TPA: DUF58 domain-containing protein [Xanthomonadaceae bacterium]|jgi:uncharacterized protein (DUF58 family)|nr:DUF58 domain-containing protein [Xanthomonadaceae bacterium]
MRTPISPPRSDGLRPSLSELIALRDRVRGWPPAQRGAATVAGPAQSPFRGRGMEYAESRPYALGDDARHIDWRLTARTGKPHTKLFQAERERVTLIIADTAPTLYFGTRVRFKSVQAARAGAIAAWAAQGRGDRIGALRGAQAEPPIAPVGGRRGVLHALDALVRWYAQSPAQDSGLEHALATAARLLHPGASLVVLADAASLAPVSQGLLATLSTHHDVLVVLLTDPLELQPPRDRLPFALGAARIELDLDGAVARAGWRHAFADELQTQTQRLQGMGARVRALRSDDGVDSMLSALLVQRRVAA